MGKLLLYTALFIAANVGLFFLFLIIPADNLDIGSSIMAFLVPTGLSLIIQLIVAFLFISNEKRKEIGKAMLLSVGIIFLFGLSLCSGLWG